MALTAGIIIINAVLFGTVYSNKCSSFEISKDNLNKALIGHSVLEVNDKNHHDCARTCMSMSVCKSFDFDRNEHVCKLNDVDQSSVDPLEFETKQGSIFSDISEWPSRMVGSCGSRPCKANQMCYQNGASHVCKDISTSCAFDQKIENGKIQISMPGENKFLDVALVKCDKGYAPSQENVKCEASGQWQPATCKKTCAFDQKIVNGQVQISAPGENKFLDVAQVKCDKGYVPSQQEVKCEASGQWQPASCKLPSDCKEVLDKAPEAKSGQYVIELWTSGKILTVNCDMETDGGGWTIFQRRMDGSVDFYRNFTEYENGFGTVDAELWLGLKYIQELAEQGSTEIRIDMTRNDSSTGHETCSDFKLKEGTHYTLNIGSCTGVGMKDAGYGIAYNNQVPFSTYDRDLDMRERNCAKDHHGAWWYSACSFVDLNGFYVTPGTEHWYHTGALWGIVHHEFDKYVSLKTSSMMIRRK